MTTLSLGLSIPSQAVLRSGGSPVIDGVLLLENGVDFFALEDGSSLLLQE